MLKVLRAVILCALSAAPAVSRLHAGLLGPIGPDIQVLAPRREMARDPKVAVFPKGNFVVVWTALANPPATNEVHARLFRRTGAPASSELVLLPPNGQVLSDLAATPDGGFILVWDQPNPQGITRVVARKFDAAARPSTRPLRISAPSLDARHDGRVAVAADGSFVVAFQAEVGRYGDPGTSIDAHARFFGPDGTAAGPEITVDVAFPGDGSVIAPRAVGLSPDRSAVIVSECECAENPVLVQRFSADGTELRPAYSLGNGYNPRLSIDGSGLFVVAWATSFAVGNPGPFDQAVILAQRFAVDGTPGELFQVSKLGQFEIYPWLAPLSGGGFVVLWTDEAGRDGSGLGVFGRAFSERGTPTTGDFRVNLQTAGDQVATAVAASGGVPMVVAVWAERARFITYDHVASRGISASILPLQ